MQWENSMMMIDLVIWGVLIEPNEKWFNVIVDFIKDLSCRANMEMLFDMKFSNAVKFFSNTLKNIFYRMNVYR